MMFVENAVDAHEPNTPVLVTVRTADGGKITNEARKLLVFRGDNPVSVTDELLAAGAIYINQRQIVYIRLATQEEAEHYKNHGW